MGESTLKEMVTEKIKSLAIIGSGNVATHIGQVLACQIPIVQVTSKTIEHATTLADAIGNGCTASDKLEKLVHADAYCISVNDDAIPGILARIAPKYRNSLWFHTSGSTGIDVFKGFNSRHGILYPLQTFSRNIAVDFAQIPIFTEGSNSHALADIDALAELLSPHIYHADSRQREYLHIAAVFACNFSNYLYSQAEDILEKANLPFSVLLPLIGETVRKASLQSPATTQTGPAVRGDIRIQLKHLAALGKGTSADIYKLLSNAIAEQHNIQTRI